MTLRIGIVGARWCTCPRTAQRQGSTWSDCASGMYDVDQGGGEARLAIETPYRRLPNLRLAEGSVPHQFPGATFRTYGMLQLQYDGPCRAPLQRGIAGRGVPPRFPRATTRQSVRATRAVVRARWWR